MGLLRRSTPERARILFATDLHGSEVVFRKLLNAVGVYEASVLILGGDLTGKRIIPVLSKHDGWITDIGGVERRASTLEERELLEREIRDLGHYPVIVDADELARMREDPDRVEEAFVQACHAQVTDWMQRAAERLEPAGVPVYVTGGNDDYFSIEPILESAPHIVNAEGRVVEVLPGVEMISTGYGNPTPWTCPRDISEEELRQRIEDMAVSLQDPAKAIFNLHVPPYGSGLDTCPKLDTSLDPPRPVVGEEISAGSTAVRGAIEEYGPTLSLHGHIHECRGIQRIGHTTCVNPGSEYGEGILRSAVIDFDGRSMHAQLLAA